MRFQGRPNWWNSGIFLIFLLFFAWAILQVIAPLMIDPSSIGDLSGTVAISDNQQRIQEMGVPWNLIYTAGDRLCHQQSDRSLFINGNQLPFCSRCTAIFFGITLGIGVLVVYLIPLNEKFLFVLLFGLTPIGIDGVGQLLGFWESTNFIRVITGILAGVVCGLALGMIYDECREIFKKRKKDDASS